jgi:hypothetical protein
MKVSLQDMPTSVLSTLVQQAQLTTINSIKTIGLICFMCISFSLSAQQVDMNQNLLVSSYVVTLVDYSDGIPELDQHEFTPNRQMTLQSILNIDEFVITSPIECYAKCIYTMHVKHDLVSNYAHEYNLVKNAVTGNIEKITIFKYRGNKLLKSIVYKIK